jgi:hypothetical protein
MKPHVARVFYELCLGQILKAVKWIGTIITTTVGTLLFHETAASSSMV